VEFGFVAALEREVAAIVRGWSRSDVRMGTAERRIYRGGDRRAALICAGTGKEQAYAASKLLVAQCSPKVLVSIGFAGACVASLHPGSIVVPAAVVEEVTGKSFACALGRGHLVAMDSVAGKGLKRCAASRFGALAVDMEASGVGAAAVECGRQFVAIKAISDGVDEDLGFLAGFVTPDGFAMGRFLTHIALRPGMWPSVAALQRNSKLAAAALQQAVEECMADWTGFSARYSDASSMKESG
jgi:nucleoside phosphorylase